MAVISIKNKTKSGSLLVGNAPYIPNDYESIATVTVGAGGASNITFSSIPSTYQHLQIRALSLNNVGNDYIFVKFNSDATSANYRQHYLLGDGASAAAGATTGSLGARTYTTYGPNNYFTAGTMDLLDYANVNKYKTLRSLGGFDTNNTDGGIIWFTSSLWMSTAAVNQIDLRQQSGNFKQYSSFALYGIKG
jgi:hypothetical protein